MGRGRRGTLRTLGGAISPPLPLLLAATGLVFGLVAGALAYPVLRRLQVELQTAPAHLHHRRALGGAVWAGTLLGLGAGTLVGAAAWIGLG